MSFDQIKELLVIVLAPLSVLAGTLLSYYLTNRSKNADFFADKIMEKKIIAYEALNKEMNPLFLMGFEHLIRSQSEQDKDKIDAREKQYLDEFIRFMELIEVNQLYLDEDVANQLATTYGIPNKVSRLLFDAHRNGNLETYESDVKKLTKIFNNEHLKSINMIREYMGMRRLEKSFEKMNNIAKGDK